MILPLEWLTGQHVLTAPEVKRMAIGSKVWIHQCYGKRGEHVKVLATICQSGKKKVLKYYDWNGRSVYKDILTKENIAYTMPKENET